MNTINPCDTIEAFFTGRSLNATAQTQNEINKRSVYGRLIFNDDLRSVEDTKIKFFVKDIFNINHYVGSVKTDSEGRFFLQYFWKKRWYAKTQNLVIGVVEKHLPFKQHGFHFKQEFTLEKLERQVPEGINEHNLGTLKVNFADISRDVSVVQIPTPTHMQPISYFLKLLKAIVPEFLKKVFISIFSRWITIEKVQRIFDSFGPCYPKRASSPENLIDELLNHISAIDPLIIDNKVIWSANWDGLEFDRNTSLPNIRVVATKKDKETLTLDYIGVKFREDEEETIIRPFDENIGWGIYLARSAFCLKGEAEVHLGEGHILPSIPAKVFFKHIKPGNPMFAPLEPHLSQLDFINWFGSRGLIFGTGSVLDASALNDKSILEVIIKAMKQKADWLNYSPQEPIITSHYNASAEQLHYNLLLKFFNAYIQKNLESITEHWSSIYNWSAGMSELIDTLPKITQNKYNPSGIDLQHLAKFSAWLVTKTTFIHWSAHSRQQLLTDIRQSSLAPEEKALNKDGRLDPYGNTTPENGMRQLTTSRVLMSFDGDSIFKDPNGDMDKDLLKLLRSHMKDYKGYDDIIKMHLTTQI